MTALGHFSNVNLTVKLDWLILHQKGWDPSVELVACMYGVGWVGLTMGHGRLYVWGRRVIVGVSGPAEPPMVFEILVYVFGIAYIWCICS